MPKTPTRSTANAAEGSLVDELVKSTNAIATKMDALLAKLDADTGITDTNYAATIGASADDVIEPRP